MFLYFHIHSDLIIGECIGNRLHVAEEIPSQEDCLNVCQQTENCKWFTFIQTSQTCLLFTDCETLDETCAECTSGQSRCQVEEEGSFCFCFPLLSLFFFLSLFLSFISFSLLSLSLFYLFLSSFISFSLLSLSLFYLFLSFSLSFSLCLILSFFLFMSHSPFLSFSLYLFLFLSLSLSRSLSISLQTLNPD
jgi:hypothetical protein